MTTLDVFGVRVLVVDGVPLDRALVVSRVESDDGEERLSAVLLTNIGPTASPAPATEGRK